MVPKSSFFLSALIPLEAGEHSDVLIQFVSFQLNDLAKLAEYSNRKKVKLKSDKTTVPSFQRWALPLFSEVGTPALFRGGHSRSFHAFSRLAGSQTVSEIEPIVQGLQNRK